MLETVHNYIFIWNDPKFFSKEELDNAIYKATIFGQKHHLDIVITTWKGISEGEFEAKVKTFKRQSFDFTEFQDSNFTPQINYKE